jgi:hypothetical protein
MSTVITRLYCHVIILGLNCNEIKVLYIRDDYFKGIVGAVVIFDHSPKFGIIFLVSDHPAHEKLIARKFFFLLSNN